MFDINAPSLDRLMDPDSLIVKSKEGLRLQKRI